MDKLDEIRKRIKTCTYTMRDLVALLAEVERLRGELAAITDPQHPCPQCEMRRLLATPPAASGAGRRRDGKAKPLTTAQRNRLAAGLVADFKGSDATSRKH